MTDRLPSNPLQPNSPESNPPESNKQSIGSRETIAPSGLDLDPKNSGPFPSLPVMFGRFEVRKHLGKGAMGTVYLAFDPELNKPEINNEVAIKIPLLQTSDDSTLLERFCREAQATGAMNHPNICGMYEVGEINGTHYISMEYIDGRPLADYIGQDQQPQLPRQVAGIIRKLAEGLAHAHERGFIHRDLKPTNVMIATNGQPKIMDFGLARRFGVTGDIRLTQSNTIVGSPAYMSPEQARSENDTLTPASDIYSLGTLFFELLTCELPFKGPLAVVLGMIALNRVPKPSTIHSDVDPRLEALCLKMLEKKVASRPKSMTEVAHALTEWLRPAASKSNPVMTLVEEPVTLTPKKTAAPRADKTDGIENQKRRVTDLLDQHEYGAAISHLEKMTNLKDARFAPLVAWAKPKLKEVRATEQQRRESSAPSCATAEQLLQHYDYAGAVELLTAVPSAYRSLELRDLLSKATEIHDECEHLQRSIEEAIRDGDKDALPGLVKGLLKLKPNNKAIKQLATEVKELGAAKVIAHRKGQRQTFDPAGRVVEPSHILWSMVLVLGLFVGVSLMLNNYLKRIKAPVLPLPQPTETVSPKPSPPIPTPIAVIGPLPQTITSQATGMKLTLIPAGTFTMGSPASEMERSAEEGPQHMVRISQPFYMGVYEVTQSEYEQVMGTNPSYFSKSNVGSSKLSGQDTGTFPVELVAWYGAIEFCNALSAKDGLPAYYTLTNVKREGQTPKDSITSAIVSVSGGQGYRLPTEAEWEYACRADTPTPFHFGSALNADKANVNGDVPYGTTAKGKYLKRSTTVGSYPANALDLYDMHGNVWEWCEDVYDEKVYANRAETMIDPLVKNGSEYRVLRGGSWDNSSEDARSAGRNSGTPDGRSNVSGFRVVFSAAAVTTPDGVTGTSPIAPKNEPAPVVLPSSSITVGTDLNLGKISDPNRRFAHWVIQSGGTVALKNGQWCNQLALLPPGAFTVDVADLVELKTIPEPIEAIAQQLKLTWVISKQNSPEVAIALAVRNASTLRSIKFQGTVTDTQLAQLRESNILEAFEFNGCYGYSEVGVKTLKMFPNLKRVSFNAGAINDAGLAHLAGLKKIEDLVLWATSVTDAGLINLKGMSELQGLQLGTSRGITGPGIQHLVGLPKLKSLSLYSIPFGDAGMEHVGKLSAIESLILGETKITDAQLYRLDALSKLKVLHLHTTQVTDAGLAKLVVLGRLTELQLDGTGLTNAGLANIRRHKNLKRLYVRKTKVTEDAVNAFRKALPSCAIESDFLATKPK